MSHSIFFNLILVLKNFYIKTYLHRLLLKYVTILITAICFSFIASIHISMHSQSSALGYTISNSTLQPKTCRNNQPYDSNAPVDRSCIVDSSIVGVPAANFNKLKTLRIAVVGDIDSNQGLATQLELANYYNVQALIIPGDFEYSNGNEVLNSLQSHGFTKENTDIVVGNHDSANDIKTWLDSNSTYGKIQFPFTNNVELFNIDANIKFDCSSPQFQTLKSQIESSTALYKFAVVHEPFVTVKSDHADNGQFDCYDPLFRANGVDAVLQAHNHNYQRFNINGLMYGVFGTGTHDTGSAMYPLNSNSWEGNECLKCITGKNGITIIDLNLNSANSKHFVGWFIGMGKEILDKF
jgi:calcineurin-like phosphoesterase family protein